jgi:hypothetical protein
MKLLAHIYIGATFLPVRAILFGWVGDWEGKWLSKTFEEK